MDIKLIQDLRSFGLNEYEARAYLVLTIQGPLSASEISKHSGIAQSKVYEVLKSLERKSLIENWSKKPKCYKAVEPLYGLRKIISEKRNDIKNLEMKTDGIVSKIKPNHKSEFSDTWTSKGKLAFMQKATEMLQRTKSFGCAMTSSFSRYPQLDKEFLNVIKRGIRVRMLGTAALNDKFSKARANWYAKNGAEIKILLMSTHPTLGFRDNEEMCLRIDRGKDNSEFIWSSNPALINIMTSYFENLWEKAKTFSIS